MEVRFVETRKDGGGGEEEEEEERLTRMVNDFLESEATFASFPTSPENDPLDDTLLSLERIIGSSTKAEKEAYGSVMRHFRLSGNEGKYSSKKGLVLSMRTDGYEANMCRSSWVSSVDCPGGAYEYIEIMAVDEQHQKHPKRLIIDIDFRSQFEIARPTKSYALLTNSIPSVFVGGEIKLKKIISLTCSAAEKSLKERGLHIPPWRKANYMQSKWLSPGQRVPLMSFPILSRNTERPSAFGALTASSRFSKYFDRDTRTPPKVVNLLGRDIERSSAKVINCAPPNLMPKRRQLGFSQSSLRCSTVA